jgi:hypothetical protein
MTDGRAPEMRVDGCVSRTLSACFRCWRQTRMQAGARRAGSSKPTGARIAADVEGEQTKDEYIVTRGLVARDSYM